MSVRPRVLDELGLEVERAAHRTLGGKPPRRRYRVRPAGALALLVALLLLAAAATAAVLLIQRGSPLPAPHGADLRASGVPLAGTARLAGLDVPDPDASQPPWDLRISRTAGGETCTAVGQVVGGRLGIVGLDHVFRALPPGGADACGIDTPSGPVLAGAQDFLGPNSGEARTVVSGVAGPGARSVTAYAGGEARPLHLGVDGSFMAVYRGEAEAVRPSIVVLGADGVAHRVDFERSRVFEARDPAGGSPWGVSASADLGAGAYPDEQCVQATELVSQQEPGHVNLPLTPEVCGRLADSPLVLSIRRFVPGEDRPPFPWGNAPSRTLVYGVAAPRVLTITLEGAGAPRILPIDPHGGAFLAVLDGRIDPRLLNLTVRLRDGATVRLHHSTALLNFRTNRPEAQLPVPEWVGPSSDRLEERPAFVLPIASTVRETLRAADPAGGPTWVLRSWQGRPNPALRAAPTERNYCEELAIASPHGLLEPTADPSITPQPLNTEQASHCYPEGIFHKLKYLLSSEGFLDDPYAYSPSPQRTVLSGLLPPGASDPMLLDDGQPRRLPLDANNAFLLVLPGRYWDSSPRITYLLDGKLIQRPAGHGNGARVPQVRAPDPAGSAPWGFLANADCFTATGRVVDGIFAQLDPQNGVVTPGAGMTGGSGACQSHAGAGLAYPAHGTKWAELNVTPAEHLERVTGPAPPLGTAEIEQRSLPGRTIISGVTRPQVLSVTLSTPSDVRTLRPTGPQHVILAVYSGFFLRGELTATLRLRDGRTVTEPLFSPIGGEAPPMTIVRTRRFLERALQRERRKHHAANSRAARFLRETEARLAVIRRRIAYEAGHPGLLPAE